MFLALIVWLVMTALPAIKIGGYIVAGAFAALMLICAICYADTGEDDWLRGMWKQKIWVVPVFLLALLAPDEKTSWYMVGAYTTQTIAQSDTAKELAGDGVDVLKSLMKKAKQHIDAIDATAAEEAKK